MESRLKFTWLLLDGVDATLRLFPFGGVADVAGAVGAVGATDKAVVTGTAGASGRFLVIDALTVEALLVVEKFLFFGERGSVGDCFGVTVAAVVVLMLDSSSEVGLPWLLCVLSKILSTTVLAGLVSVLLLGLDSLFASTLLALSALCRLLSTCTSGKAVAASRASLSSLFALL